VLVANQMCGGTIRMDTKAEFQFTIERQAKKPGSGVVQQYQFLPGFQTNDQQVLPSPAGFIQI